MSNLTEIYMEERIKLKNSNDILASSVLDEMYKLKLHSFFMKRSCINDCLLPP